MAELKFEQSILAPREKVWAVITEQYPQWIAAVCGEGAKIVGTWQKENTLEFHAPNGKGGLVARLVEYDKPQTVKWEAVGAITDGKPAEFSALTEMMRGMSEQYTLTEVETGKTHLTATLQTPDIMQGFTAQKWPAAMQTIKTLAEQ